MTVGRGVRMAVGAALCAAPAVARAQARASAPDRLVVRNNHEIAYTGPLDLTVDLPDGRYAGPGASADVRGGRAHAFVRLEGKGEVALTRVGALAADDFADGPFAVSSSGAAATLRWQSRSIGDVSLGLVVIPGDSATTDSAERAFVPAEIEYRREPDGAYRGNFARDGYTVDITARPYGAGWLDVAASVVRTAPTTAAPAYLALVRRLITPSPSEARQRFQGRALPGATSPSEWQADFRYAHGVDWTSWRAGDNGPTLLSVNGFTPVPSVKHGDRWGEGSHFYVWELTRQAADTTWLVSEIAGPNGHQPTKGYMAVAPYAQPPQGDTVALSWRLAVAQSPDSSWATSQLYAFAGTRLVSRSGDAEVADIGARSVMFGISYFPYSTFAENFDYYRTPGLNQEGFWPTSPVMWKQWRRFVPRMRTDLHIIRAMGFDAVRLHHLELLQTLDRADALAFLDFYAAESRRLGLHWLVDTEGPPEWVTTVLGRYADLAIRMEIENENLIPGITPDEPARWTAMYRAAKAADPNAQVYLTGAGNFSMDERLRTLGVPFDRVGLHAYKHGPEWPETFASHMLGAGGYATSIGRAVTLGEFNWKDLTRMSPEARRASFAGIYADVLAPRAIPEVFEFQLHEDIAFNAAVAGTLSRHYEPLWLDRRPKPEAFVAMELMRKYERPDAPTRRLPVTIAPATFAHGSATATYTVTNATGHPVVVRLTPVAYDGTRSTLAGSSLLRLAAGASASGRVKLSLPAGALPGTYHHFVEASFGGATSIGWGVAYNEGAPRFADTTVLGPHVAYVGGPGIVRAIDWARPLAVVFGAKSPALEVESAYQLANTLQSATGRAVWISSEQDLPDSLSRGGTVLLVGTPATNQLVAAANVPVAISGATIGAARTGRHPLVAATNARGTIAVDGAAHRVTLTGPDARGVEAAVVELELRYWPNAKDATSRVVGLEPGAALGHRAGGSVIDPP